MDKTNKTAGRKPLIGITLGDFNGIGPEVIIKALSDNRIMKLATPIIYGSSKILSYYRKALKINDFNYNTIRSIENINPKKANVINCWEDTYEIHPGSEEEIAGKCAFLALERATADLQAGLIDGIVTAPINKNNIQNESFKFPGHTEYLTKKFKAEDSLMLMVGEDLRIGVVTGHVPLKDVSKKIHSALLLKKIQLMEDSLKIDFGISKPKIAILGLNPHAGEEGLLGQEEDKIITPVISKCKQKGMLVFGPYPSDGFFGMMHHKKFDAVLAMYHDQGLIPFKTLCFESGVNYTAGLPVIRTSPDHGTAYNIAGKNQAEASSMREALFLTLDIIKNRLETKLIKA
ncbi:4-hydroxythreonine-4-phosphate dehydrogenase PdxA [Xanthovirga aplysinae]|uniref:4-hydroxythreonine-4-phosphate dehydrogenase PdxA n=1 Tax=Xanthovirga aplysinae TaxID=2529853 RepID=UPI0012BCE8D8|nr:4-hydroxythreonine-4-phosphate dehydrogenase PdxA [Xanthovirga aplysinae]MTI33598.1 4-hydroxythreonine-4-phosphate dehydrogenase PdxA [Xanthovirga aplysinae]